MTGSPHIIYSISISYCIFLHCNESLLYLCFYSDMASEASNMMKSEVLETSSSVVRTVVTRTVVQESSVGGEPAQLVQSKTTTTRTTMQDGDVTSSETSTVVEQSGGKALVLA